MTEKNRVGMPEWGLPALSWLVSFYFLAGFVANAGFPPKREILIGDALYVFLWLFFLFLPFFSKIKIGGMVELERKLEQAKDELREFKQEVRNSVSVLSTNVNTIGGMTNHVTVNIPQPAELRDARKTVESRSPAGSSREAEDLEAQILNQSEDKTMALAKTRIEIERHLRRILGKRLESFDESGSELKFMGAKRLFDVFVRQYDDFIYLRKPFHYVTQICNAAMHAQNVTDEQADEALALGAKIIAVLNDLPQGEPPG